MNEDINTSIEQMIQTRAEDIRRADLMPTKPITEIGMQDIQVKLDQTKSYNDQAEDVLEMQTTAKVASDEMTQEMLANEKKAELVRKATAKRQQAQRQVVEAETEVQKAEREAYAGILETFGFFKHLPHWLTNIIVWALTPFLLIIGFVVGVPCVFIKILIDNIDGILVRYEKAGEERKPKIKVTVWLLLALAVLACVSLTVLACLGVI